MEVLGLTVEGGDVGLDPVFEGLGRVEGLCGDADGDGPLSAAFLGQIEAPGGRGLPFDVDL